MLRQLIGIPALSLLITLSGCGSGSDNPSTLSIGISHPTTASVWEPTVLKADITGLQGRQLTCNEFRTLSKTLSSAYIPPTQLINGLALPDLSMTLPSGFSIDTVTCDIKVDVLYPGDYQFAYQYSVPGYYSTSGGTFASARINVIGPRLTYDIGKTASGAPSLVFGVPIQAAQSQPRVSGYVPLAGDLVTFSAPVIPAGLSINSTTGVLSGVPTAAGGPLAVDIRMTVKRGAVTRVFFNETRQTWISAPSLSYSVPPVVSLASARTGISPSWLNLNSTDVVTSYTSEFSANCPNYPVSGLINPSQILSVDSVSGVVRPATSVAGNYCGGVAATVLRNGFETVLRSTVNIFVQ
jgi:Putative Ig domain